MPIKHSIKSILVALATLAALPAALAQAAPKKGQSQTVASPNGSIVVSVAAGADLRWSVTMNGQPVLLPSKIGMAFNSDKVIGKNPVIRSSKTATVDQVLRPVLKIKRAEIKDRYNERRIDFAGDYSLIVRAYDDGVAYRFSTKLPGNVEVMSEDAEFQFSANHKMYFPEEASFFSHQERQYLHIVLSEVGNRFCSLPAIVETGPPASTAKIAITEADLLDYPGMNLTGAGRPNCLKGLFPYYPAKVELRGDRAERVLEREQFMAKTKGARDFPWRVLVLAENDSTFLETDIVYRLASETRLTDTSWIKSGKVSWDWWNATNIYGVSFRAGINTETYKHYIDFAAENDIEYILLDEGWYKLGDLMTQTQDINMD
ncbi:MAG: glycoside hydrolase family 97 N-terminal domain-containing protein, partial [Holophagales bacterium]|nr:glycoside hydrolase family 97 N-terminal domain-containing protein [Holophagales bacterium]